jgi:hypothetical protein
MHNFTLTISFVGLDEEHTCLTWRETFESENEANLAGVAMEDANEQNLDRFALHLRTGL